MKLRNLFESPANEVALIFGRFNPPHKGHRAAWEIASKSPVWYVGTNQSTVGAKDPLPFDVKIQAMKTVWPEVEGHIVAETSWLTAASMIYKKHGDVTLLCLTDEDWVTKTIKDYNGKEGSHGYYNFPNIEQRPTPRLSSATALRDAVAKGDREAFTQAAGVSADMKVAGKPFFDLVAEYLLPYQNAPKKATKKKKEPEVAEGSTLDKIKNTAKKAAVAFATSRANPVAYAIRKGLGQSHDEYKKNVKKGAGVEEGIFGLSSKEKAKIQYVTAKISDIPGNWDHKNQQYTEQGLKDLKSVMKNEKYLKYALSLTADDYEAESTSPAMAQTAKRLTDPKDGATAKLRAAGDKRREDHLKSRNIAKKNEDMSIEEARQSAQVKLAKAWDRQKAKSAASRERAKELLNPKKSDEPTDQKKNEEAAGMGIITKQNTTKDVNKGTLRKMMKGYRLI